MQVEPVNTAFHGKNVFIEHIKPTSYGKCIHGKSVRGFEYDAYVAEDKQTGNIMHKLYYVSKDNKFVKSVLRFFSDNKVYKELRGQAK